MNLRKEAQSMQGQVADLLDGRCSWIRISEYYTAKNVGGSIQLHSTAPGSVDNEFLTLLLTDVAPIADFFNVVTSLREPLKDGTEVFIDELKNLKPRRAIKKGDKVNSDVSQ